MFYQGICSYNSFTYPFFKHLTTVFLWDSTLTCISNNFQVSAKTSPFITVTHKYMLDLNVELNHDTVKTLEKYTVHLKKKKQKKPHLKAYAKC